MVKFATAVLLGTFGTRKSAGRKSRGQVKTILELTWNQVPRLPKGPKTVRAVRLDIHEQRDADMAQNTTSLGLRIPSDLADVLDRVVEATGRPRNEIVVEALRAYLNGLNSLRDWKDAARAAWVKAHEAVAAELHAVENALEAARTQLEELEKHWAELTRAKDEALAVVLEGHKKLDPGAVRRARERIVQLDAELAALEGIQTEARKRIKALEEQREELVRKRSAVFLCTYEELLLPILKRETEKLALHLEAFYGDTIEALAVSRDLSVGNGYGLGPRWLYLYAISRIFDTTEKAELRRALKNDLPFSRELSDFAHVEKLICNELRPKLVREPLWDERPPRPGGMGAAERL